MAKESLKYIFQCYCFVVLFFFLLLLINNVCLLFLLLFFVVVVPAEQVDALAAFLHLHRRKFMQDSSVLKIQPALGPSSVEEERGKLIWKAKLE